MEREHTIYCLHSTIPYFNLPEVLRRPLVWE